ncbi:MAG: glycosyltransferase [Paludibacteraceae bacterium]|nr:glycosyltransferase [Paludibacteraceae bacterium]
MILSIITINYNNVKSLIKTLNSVASQTFKGFEHIIIDGGSSDGSAYIIKDYAAKSPFSIKWVSEPDKGIYNAMNKGIRMATGDYIQILNSGDYFVGKDVIERITDALKKNDYPKILYGNMLRVNPNGNVIGKSEYTEYSLRQFFSATLNHNCAFIKRDLFDKYGFYDESLTIVSDWKWYLQVIGLGNVKPIYVDIDVTLFDCGGISEKNLKRRNEERRKVLEEILPPAILADYDKHEFETRQVDRIRKYHLYPIFYFVERVLFKLEKWRIIK